jgi:hypothetical protein
MQKGYGKQINNSHNYYEAKATEPIQVKEMLSGLHQTVIKENYR